MRDRILKTIFVCLIAIFTQTSFASGGRQIFFCAPDLTDFAKDPIAHAKTFFEIFYAMPSTHPNAVLDFDICRNLDECTQSPPHLKPFRFFGAANGPASQNINVTIHNIDGSPTGASFQMDSATAQGVYQSEDGKITKMQCGIASADIGPAHRK